jgi:hypothetical protein
MAGSFAPVTSGTSAINNILVQEANRVGQDIYQHTLHTSPWVDLIKKGSFPDGYGYQLNTLVYDRALPQSDGDNTGTFNVLGLNWANVASSALTSSNSALNSAALIEGSSIDRTGPRNKSARIDFTKKLKSYNLQRASVESPRINVDDLRFAAYRTEQLGAIMNILRESTHRSWEERYRDEFDRLAGNFVPCLTSGTPIVQTIDVSAGTTKEGTATVSIDLNNDFVSSGVDVDYTPTANISNAIMDRIRMRMIRMGAGQKAYGRENSAPVFGLILSSEASYALQTEAGFRDDIRYNGAKVSELIAPLGVEKGFRGFYHLIDDLAPRFTASSGTLTRVRPEVYSNGVLIPNSSYDTADYEAAYVLHEEVMEALIPSPNISAGGVSFNPVNYRGDFKWLNIPDEVINPDGTIGFFRGVLASASKPIKPEFGYVILFKRTTTTPAGL